MVIDTPLEPVHILTNHQVLVKCTDFSYLGSAISSNVRTDEEICYWVENASGALGKLLF